MAKPWDKQIILYILNRCSYDSKGLNNKGFFALPASEYPWGVCHSKYGHFTYEQRQWTKEAMETWNWDYSVYKLQVWSRHKVIGIPNNPLFVESCDETKYNIIYTKTEDLWYPKIGQNTVAYYKSVHKQDGLDFYGIIAVDYKIKWIEPRFTNVMIHELGHALGLPHAKKGKSQLLVASDFDCGDKKGHYKVCKLLPYDFWQFIKIYDPPDKNQKTGVWEHICRHPIRGFIRQLCLQHRRL